jgi:hypothetical protein
MRFPALLALLAPVPLLAAPVDFAREIRPILSENCFACHGPDAPKRKAELRLDTRDGAFGKGESGAHAFVPGKPADSEALKRILSTDPEEMMPPPKEHKKLKPGQVDLLKRWLAEGAPYTGHWAFEKIRQPVLPEGVAKGTGQGTIDAFIRTRLAKEGLAPTPEEEKPRLLRRVTLDLTGLPPTPQELDAFLADPSPNAYEKVVDRLLASPAYGERMAVPWLDLARFADTAGYHNDSLRDMWMWRDWVIKAFNDNKPFSDFTLEQLAGDLIPGSTIDQKVASGFHRNVMTSDEGGIIDAEYLNLYIVDRVNTTGVTWLGLTVGCAQCHDHKYDPLTMRDYYGMYAFFHNVPENGKDGVREKNPAPVLTVATPEQEKELARLDVAAAAAAAQLKELAKTLDAEQAEWETKIVASGQAVEPPGPWAKIPLDADGNGTSDGGQPITATPKGEFTFVEGSVGNSFRVEAKGWLEYGEKFGFEKDQAFTVTAWLRLKPQGGSPFGKMDAVGAIRGWDVEFHGTKPSFHLINTWPDNTLHVQGQRDLPTDTFLHFAVTYDGSGKGAGAKMYVNGQLEKTNVVIDKLSATIKTDTPFSIGRRGDGGPTFTGRVDDFRIYSRALNAGEISAIGGGATLAIASIEKAKRTPQQAQQLQKFFRDTQATAYIAAQAKVDAAKKARAELEKNAPNTMVMVEMEKPRDTFLKLRGAYDKNGDKVTAAVPAFLPALAGPPAPTAHGDKIQRHTRLDFAKWLLSPDHPLTARVAVNRWWAMLFGTGIVKTVNDFGNQSEWPSHPELLDWLAADFQRDWNVKRTIKQMVMSATYRQSSRVTPALLAKDSENRLLARGPRHRLDAEFVRDNALAIGGLLNRQMGGKGIFPAQPAGIWEVNAEGNNKWQQQRGPEQYRRGLYVYWRRSTPYPSFLTFDAPNREFCAAARARTSTPLQSLVLMNDPVYVEAARALAQRVLQEPADTKSRLSQMWRHALTRPPADQELAILQSSLDKQLARYAQDAKAAEALIKVGDLPRPDAVKPTDLAAWTAVASIILNLNETITN